ncbi:hypothetical protein [Phenylobacterium sp.]|uniref:hypothetical protein n=1 Tax=Phenylobacterium sp. TaxID=1871053 RepID=UPI0035AE5056
MADDQYETRGRRAATEAAIERVAVVFAHGQGEQVPMQDVTELAETVWSKAVADDPHAGFRSQVWSVPVYDADMSEQRRLVTGVLRRGAGRPPLQVDFYQFYWADLMTGNRFIQLWRWFVGLMKRKPDTPEALEPLRRIAMTIGLLAGLFGLVFGAVTAARLVTREPFTWGNLYALLLTGALAAQVWMLAAPSRRLAAFTGGLGLTLASLLLGLAAGALTYKQEHLLDWLVDGPLSWAEATAWTHSALAALLMALVALSGVQFARLYSSFLVPVMADSARMLSATPENIPARDRIRRRGMELLEALHHSERQYDRIIFVAHSLGSIVAYNVINQYWGNIYRLLDHGQTAAERARVEQKALALNEAAAHAAAASGRKALTEARLAYRAAVRDYHAVLKAPDRALNPQDVEWLTAEYASVGHLLRRTLRTLNRIEKREPRPPPPRPPWLISDFVTIGSPLTYGKLLMAGGGEDFEAQFRTRRHAECPPSMLPREGFTYKGRVHHAAAFAATCWTNIFFETEGLIRGDIIGGPVAGAVKEGRFGWGPQDVAVRREPRMPEFAHNAYWCFYTAADGAPAEHVLALRAALCLLGDADAADRKLVELAPPRSETPPADAPAPPPVSRPAPVEA